MSLSMQNIRSGLYKMHAQVTNVPPEGIAWFAVWLENVRNNIFCMPAEFFGFAAYC